MNWFVSVDPAKCIGCRTCEIACALAHPEEEGALYSGNFFPRLTLERTAKITAPNICRHCKDAACVKACSNQALVFRDGTVQILRERCMGCQSCVVACPYDSMKMIKLEAEPQPGCFSTYRMRSVAHKCDLCLDRAEGQACVQVCPTHALTLVDPKARAETKKCKEQLAGAQS